ncbi:nitrogenase molybdenum-cofactor synthesis protein NifE [Desulfobaculum xiamenense]|uniref:Nitrogenase molybdenum-cofactor synthesis protein NifE n=1 Tax=Desulfobaculum xiamenense TaxID=995050 RepID=A0A846QPG1_9BACT|nr:nitrogenase component 1 [Desulfobaculum xiamenense]NJB68203.1 nitrogenase molybdenum-cofactor synthesis protein NifE [Desulfobaculum xiamenense]
MDLDHAGIRLEHLRKKPDFPFAPLEGVGPNLAGWGVIETCLLLPESVAVMAGPSACLRHSAFMAHARGFTDRFHMLCLSELDMTLGNHLDKVERGVADIIARRDEKVVFLIVGCPDYILGTDFSGVIRRLEEKTGRRIILGAMAPITIGLKESPFTSAYTSFFEFLKHEPRRLDDGVVNLLGTFMPLSESGELYQVLTEAGMETVVQIPLCRDLAEFSRMAHARASVVLHPLANGLCGKMEQEMGIPSCFAPTSYGFSTIREQYGLISEAIGRALPIDDREQEARRAAEPLLADLRGKKTAVGCSINGSPFELALFLVQNGLSVDTIFARGTIKPYEWELVERLRAVKPDIMVYNASHPALCGRTESFDDVELAYGVDAGIYCVNAANVPLSRYQEQKYGYEATLWMLEQTHEALEHPVSNYEWIYGRNFLI